MAIYKLIPYGVTKDGKFHIGNSLDNTDWVEYQRWLAAGNVPDPEDVIVPPDPDDPDRTGRETQVLLKVIADITGMPLAQVKTKFRGLSGAGR